MAYTPPTRRLEPPLSAAPQYYFVQSPKLGGLDKQAVNKRQKLTCSIQYLYCNSSSTLTFRNGTIIHNRYCNIIKISNVNKNSIKPNTSYRTLLASVCTINWFKMYGLRTETQVYLGNHRVME